MRYVDPKKVEPNESERYHPVSDPTEQTNLLDFKTGEVRDGVAVPGMSGEELKQANERLRKELAGQEATVIENAGQSPRTEWCGVGDGRFPISKMERGVIRR